TSDAAFRGGACPTPEYTIAYTGNYTTSADANCGAQGSGKTWLTRGLTEALAKKGLRSASLSLDDLYLSRSARAEVAERVHPLFAVRGVPGTHDVPLGLALLDALKRPGPVALPVFDKSSDDLLPPDQWRKVDAPFDVILFEGWCVGARPEQEAALATPVNVLEAEEDADCRWRTHANDCLGRGYQDLFARIDLLVMLRAPCFEVVARWREQQEETLRQSLGDAARHATALMDTAAIQRFVMFYERLSRHILAEMPNRADVVIDLDERRTPLAVATT
ncbi:D-glycerate 3-kinase, partial [Novosphingobium hassiacum]